MKKPDVLQLANGYEPTLFEKTVGPSMTIPDDSMSVQQLMERALNGIPPERRAMYFNEEEMDHDDVDYSKLKDLDMVEASELLAATRVKFEAEQKSIMELIAERKRMEEDKAIKKADLETRISDDLRDENEERKVNPKSAKKRPDMSPD